MFCVWNAWCKMRRTFEWRGFLIQASNRFRRVQTGRPFCTNNKPTSSTTTNHSTSDGGLAEGSSMSKYDAYRELDNLNFMTAAKILFSEPREKKEFGLDFHLVQLFFVCLPSLAVYLVAQYARYEMRRMEAELELKKKTEEEAKAKEMELEAAEEKDSILNPNLVEVSKRLDRLEETVKEIVDESKRQSGSTIKKDSKDGSDNKPPSRTEPSDTKRGTEGNDSMVASSNSKTTSSRTTVTGEAMMSGSAPVSNANKDYKGTKDARSHQDSKK